MTESVPGPVVVVGAGVVGCAVAHALAPACDVVVLERNAVAAGATGKASGLVSPVYDHGDHLAAARYATDFFREFEGGRVTFHEREGVFLVGPEERDHAREAARTASRAGFDAEYVDLETLHERYPETFGTDRFAAAVVFGDVGWIDPHSFTLALKEGAVEAGATVETGVEVTAIEDDGERVGGVRTADGRVRAETVVVAAGWRTRELLSGLVEIPTRPFRYQTMTLATDADLGEAFPVAWEHDARLYWRATPRGNLHVGGQPYFVDEPGAVREKTTEAFRHAVATRLPEYLPALGETRVLTEGTCPTGDAATPDGVPIVDAPADAPEGLVVATGMHGFGIMLAPVAAAAARAHLTGAEPPFPLAPYALDRFADRSAAVESSYIGEP